MCGRYEAGQKLRIADAFHLSVMLEDIYFGQGVECDPGSSPTRGLMRAVFFYHED